jgi:hypothetical protein
MAVVEVVFYDWYKFCEILFGCLIISFFLSYAKFLMLVSTLALLRDIIFFLEKLSPGLMYYSKIGFTKFLWRRVKHYLIGVLGKNCSRHLGLSCLSKMLDSTLHCHYIGSVQGVQSSSLNLFSVLAVSNFHNLPLHDKLAAKLIEYFECWLTSIFLICFLKLAPYLVPYFSTIPTFFVRFVISFSRFVTKRQ